MLDFGYSMIALAFIFLLASIFGERDAKYGYVLIPLLGGAFWIIGWLPDIYVASIIPLILGFGVISFLREQFREKFGSGGSASSLLWKIMVFVVFLQFAIVFVNGIAVFANAPKLESINNTFTQNYNLVEAKSAYGQYTNITAIDQLTVGLTLIWTAWNVTWAMIFGLLDIIPNMINIFHLDAAVATIIGVGFYIMIAIEVFVLLMYRTRPPEI